MYKARVKMLAIPLLVMLCEATSSAGLQISAASLPIACRKSELKDMGLTLLSMSKLAPAAELSHQQPPLGAECDVCGQYLVQKLVYDKKYDERYYELPRLFHLDDYEACLSRRGALYCLGSFRLAPPASAPAHYGVMQEYSKVAYHFNHTMLHRGYCVSARCNDSASSGNRTRSFETCVNSWSRRRLGLAASLQRLAYCHDRADAAQSRPYDLPELMLAGVFLLILLANLAGTLYDMFRNVDEKANPLLLAWSVRSNWNRFMSEDKDPRLASLSAIDGFRVVSSVFLVGSHSILITYTTYLQNPLVFEKVSPSMFGFLANTTIMVESYAVVSSFVFAHNLLLQTEGRGAPPPGLRALPRRMFNRLARIAPSHWLVVGFAATWWPRLGSGPLWAPLVGREAALCRLTWWKQMLFVDNVVRPEQKCLIPTWFLASDMQLHLLSLALMLYLLQRPRPIFKILLALFLLSVLLVFFIVYIFDLKELVFFSSAEVFRASLSSAASFNWLYASWWGNAGACLLGLALALLLRSHRAQNYMPQKNKWLVWSCRSWLVLGVCWVWVGTTAGARGEVSSIVYTALARPLGAFIFCLFIYGLCYNLDPCWRWLRWRGWRAASRLSLWVTLLHWPLNVSLAAARPALAHFSLLSLTCETLVLWVGTHALAVPLTLLVQYPAQNFLRDLCNVQWTGTKDTFKPHNN